MTPTSVAQGQFRATRVREKELGWRSDAVWAGRCVTHCHTQIAMSPAAGGRHGPGQLPGGTLVILSSADQGPPGSRASDEGVTACLLSALRSTSTVQGVCRAGGRAADRCHSSGEEVLPMTRRLLVWDTGGAQIRVGVCVCTHVPVVTRPRPDIPPHSVRAVRPPEVTSRLGASVGSPVQWGERGSP